MTKKQFIYISIICSFETYFFNEAIFSEKWLLALFWCVLLLNNLRKIYVISKMTDLFIGTTKKRK